MRIRFIPWYGGKIRVIFELLCMVPLACTAWYEPFMGSAAVTLNKSRHEVEVINDLDRGLVKLYSLMADRDTGQELLERLLKLPYSESEFVRAKRAYANGFKNVDRFKQAELTFVLVTQSFNATRQTWRKGISQREYTHSLEKNLPEVYKRLQGVRVYNMDALALIGRVKDNPRTFLLLDPPYCHELRGRGALSVYAHEMDRRKQISLLELIRDAKCYILLCGYRAKNGHDLYDQYLLPCGWKHYKLADLIKACQTTKVKDVGEEWVWLNYDPPSISKYFINHSSTEQ